MTPNDVLRQETLEAARAEDAARCRVPECFVEKIELLPSAG